MEDVPETKMKDIWKLDFSLWREGTYVAVHLPASILSSLSTCRHKSRQGRKETASHTV